MPVDTSRLVDGVKQQLWNFEHPSKYHVLLLTASLMQLPSILRSGNDESDS